MCNRCKNWAEVHEWEDGCPQCGGSNHVPKSDYRVMTDLKPYKSAVTGEEIGGRKQHREHLKQHHLIEVGNEKVNRKPVNTMRPVKEDLLRTLHQLRNR